MKKTIRLSYDTYAESPREWDGLGTLALHHNYPSDAPIEDFNEYLCELLGMDVVQCERGAKCDFYTEQMKEYLLSKLDKDYVWSYVYKYEHSGIAFSTTPFSCRFDSSLIGIIHVNKKDLRIEYGIKCINQKSRDKANDILRYEVDTYSAWANGDVYAFTIEDENGNVEDSCGGFYSIEEMVDHINPSDFGMTEDELKSHLLSLDIEY